MATVTTVPSCGDLFHQSTMHQHYETTRKCDSPKIGLQSTHASRGDIQRIQIWRFPICSSVLPTRLFSTQTPARTYS
eukprot:4641785-Ditylum_brightwellii.AAC.1